VDVEGVVLFRYKVAVKLTIDGDVLAYAFIEPTLKAYK
jgi:hypothetical protein